MHYHSSVYVIGSMFLIQLVRDVHSLRCYTCVPVLQSGEDCSDPRSDQFQYCQSNQDICRVTAVSLPGAGGVRTPTINRGCASSSDFSGQMSGFLAVGAQNCATTAEGQRVSKLCICKYDGCNAQTMGQLTDNSMFNGVPAASVSGLVMATSAGIMLLLGRALA